MTSPQDNPNDVFWLARYAHNQLAPLFEQAQAIEPSLHFLISMNFASPGAQHYETGHVDVYAHWDREGMFQYSPRLTDKAAVDWLAAKIADDVANLKPLETGIPA